METIITTSLDQARILLEGLNAPGQPFVFSGKENIQFVDLLKAFSATEISKISVGPEDVAILQYSGGTTGVPKGAVGLHRNLVGNTLQFRAWLVGLEPGREVVLVALPLYHVYGMVIAMSVGIALGASLVLIPDGRNVLDILENIDRYSATLFPGVPNMYQAINHLTFN